MKQEQKRQRRVPRAAQTIVGFAAMLATQTAGAEVCAPTRSMVEQAMPAQLEETVDVLLEQPRQARQLVDRFQPKAPVLSLAVGERLKPDNANCLARGRGRDVGEVDCQWIAKKGSGRLEVNLNEGRLRYLNTERFDSAGKSHEVDPQAAEETVGQAMRHLGFPEEELGEIKASEVFAYRYPPLPDHPPHRIALGVRALRTWNGFPVEGSSVRASINSDGAIESLSAHWPDFQLAPGLLREFRLSRAELAHRISTTLDRDFACGELGSVYIEPVFVPDTMIPAGSTPADAAFQDPAATAARTRAPFFVPALRVVAMPAERSLDESHSETTSPPVRIRAFSLMDAAGF